MDNNPPQRFPLHNHSPEQHALLTQMLAQVVSDLCNFVFGDPEKDQQMIRSHAALMGKKELLQQLIADNYPPAGQEALPSEPVSNNPPEFNPNF